MSWRIISVSSVSKLDYKMDYLIIRNSNSIKRIHLSEISVLIVESTAVSLTAYLLCELNRWNVLVILCDENRLPYGMLAQFGGSHDTSLKYRMQSKWTNEIKDTVWKEIIKAKIKSQSTIVTDCDRKKILESYIEQVKPHDLTNREGHAAKVYFNSIFGSEYTRGEDSYVNRALNYGYSILLSLFAREITVCGYCTQIGIFHDNMFNQFNLASDFMEPFRTYIDQTILSMNLSQFGHDEKVTIIDTLNKQIIIDGRKQYLLQAIRIFTKSAFQAIENNDITLLKFPNYELPIYETDSFL